MKKYRSVLSVVIVISTFVFCFCSCKDIQSQGLLFELNEDKKSYSVSIGMCADKVIDIPSYYNNLPVTEIARNGFAFSQITQVSLPNGLRKIGDKAFSHTNLTSIMIPSSVSVIGEYAFSACSFIKNIVIPQNVSEIGIGAFAASELNDIQADKNNSFHVSGKCLIETATGRLLSGGNDSVIPNDGSVKSIEPSAFSNRTKLKSIIIPSSVKSIGTEAFYKCSALTAIQVPATVKEVGHLAFGYCEGLEKAEIGAEEILEVFAYCVNLKEVILLDGTQTIAGYAFNMCKNLEKVTVCSTVKYIKNYAFYGCENLAELYFKGGQRISYDKFWNKNSGLEH